MAKEYWSLTEVIKIFEVDERFLADLEEEEIISPVRPEPGPGKHFSAAELEKLRLVKILVEDMGVNLEGVEIILRMRQTIIDMRCQFDAILSDMARELKEKLRP